MKIAIIVEWFSENMGYAENLLPKFLALENKEVHVITSTAQVYYNSSTYNETYESFLGPPILSPCIKKIDGYTLHRLPLKKLDQLIIDGLYNYLKEIKPNVVQTFEILKESTYESARYCKKTGVKLFTESHIHASVHKSINYNHKDIRENIQLFFNNRKLDFINDTTVFCYPISQDAAFIAHNDFRVPEKKIKIQSLGVDTTIFLPPNEDFKKNKRIQLRKKIGIEDEDLVCIYTGRFSSDKNPQCLADAIDFLHDQGKKVKGLFIGKGTKEEVAHLKSKAGCIVRDFVPINELVKYYWIADIGVWPAQESTSQLDAAACGLPLILSDRINVLERIDGNGLLYSEGDEKNLADIIMNLMDNKRRSSMSKIGVQKIRNNYSWEKIARDRIYDYLF